MKSNNIYKSWKQILLLLTVILGYGCEDNTYDSLNNNGSQNNVLQLNIPDLAEVQVRNSNGVPEGTIKSIQKYNIYFFDENGNLVKYLTDTFTPDSDGNITDARGVVGNGSTLATINVGFAVPDKYRVYVFLNADFDGEFLTSTATEADLNSSARKIYIQDTSRAIYFGYNEWVDGKDNVFYMNNVLASARVKLYDNAYIDYLTEGVYLVNSPDSTTFYAGTDIYTESLTKWNSIDRYVGKYQEGDYIPIPEYKTSVHSAMNGGITLPETTFSNKRMAIIWKALNVTTQKSEYFRLDFYDRTNSKYIDVQRNYCYVFHVEQVRSSGYDTPEEALIMPPSNIQYTLKFDDVYYYKDYNGHYMMTVDKQQVSLVANAVDTIPLVNVQLINNNMNEGSLSDLTTHQVAFIDNTTGEVLGTDAVQFYLKNSSTQAIEKTAGDGFNPPSVDPTKNDWDIYISTGSALANYASISLSIKMGSFTRILPVNFASTETPATALDGEETSNSYIVPVLGNVNYSFNASVMGNGATGVISAGGFKDYNGNSITNGTTASITPKSARLVWQDSKGLITQVGLTNGRVEFVKGSSDAGNAVIAVYDNVNPYASDAKVMWSWHIWSTSIPKILNYVENNDTDWPSSLGSTNRHYLMMDRNLGATSADPLTYLDQTVGLYYQFGRKDPMLSPATLTGSTDRTVYDIHENTVNFKEVNLPANGGISYAIQNPTAFITKNSSYDATLSTDANYKYNRTWIPLDEEAISSGLIWGVAAMSVDGSTQFTTTTPVKTIYDPCPPGYMVPQADFARSFYKTYSTESGYEYQLPENTYLDQSFDLSDGFRFFINRIDDSGIYNTTFFPLSPGKTGVNSYLTSGKYTYPRTSNVQPQSNYGMFCNGPQFTESAIYYYYPGATTNEKSNSAIYVGQPVRCCKQY